MRYAIICVLTSVAFTLTFAARADQPREPPVASFPADWIGHWIGPAALVAPGQPDRSFTTELIIAKTDDPARFSWTIIYAEDGNRQERAYELIVRDAAKGLYAIDEKNAIVIPATLLDATLYTSFEVMGTRINTREKLEHFGTPDERITIEMVSARSDNPETSGGGQAPEVKSVIPRSLQKATLTRLPPKPAEPAPAPAAP